LFWIARLGHMHFVAGPLLGLLIGNSAHQDRVGSVPREPAAG
jgi:hypothetical protein